MKTGRKNRVIEFSFHSKEKIKQPEDISLSVVFISPSGRIKKVPAFYDSGNVWKVRYSSEEPGIHEFETDSQPEIKGLSSIKGRCKIFIDREKNPLYRYGFPVVRNGDMVYANGKKFFWLGDTWWMGLCRRLNREGFKILAKDRAKKGFTVIQIVAGLYPDMDWYDPRGKGEKGFPWTKDFSKICPDFFRAADWRIQHIVESGLVPCIVGAWGYYINWTGIETMKKHWRNLIARWAAYPVVWCVAGETIMPYYLSDSKGKDMAFQKKAWTEIARYIKEIDPFNHIITTHPTQFFAHEMLEEPELLDINMLHIGHASHVLFEKTWLSIKDARKKFPDKPVVIGEVNYEGIGEACRQEIQRIYFWGSFLSGAKGYTYGANGIWQVNTKKKSYGPSPHGRSWGDTPWEDAYKLPGSIHVSIGKKILSGINWHNLVPCREKLILEDEKSCIFAAEIPEQLLLIYAGPPAFSGGIKSIKGLKPDRLYVALFIDPKDGKTSSTFEFQTDKSGMWTFQKHFWKVVPVWQDWVILIKEKP